MTKNKTHTHRPIIKLERDYDPEFPWHIICGSCGQFFDAAIKFADAYTLCNDIRKDN